ncbi:hypothetical protein EDB85DRAFT_1998507, partial [Lactarius pseudohatsudake]
LLVAPDASPSRPVRAGWRHARACRPRPSPSPLGRATPYARARHPRPPTLPHLRGRGEYTRACRPRPSLLPWTAPPRTRGMEVHEGTRPSIPIAPGPSPPWPRRPYARKWGTRAHTPPIVRKGGARGYDAPGRPVRAGTPHPGPPFPIRSAPAFLLSAPPRSRGKGACEGKPPHPMAPRSRGKGLTGPSRVAQQGRCALRALALTAPAPRFR